MVVGKVARFAAETMQWTLYFFRAKKDRRK